MIAADTMTLNMSTADVLGILLAAIPAFVGVMLVVAVVMFCIVGERPKGWEWVPPVFMVSILGLTVWGLWEFAHWITG